MDWHAADSLSTSIKVHDPDNALVYLFDNYSIVTQLLVNDRGAEFEVQKKLKDEHLKQLKKSQKDSPYYRYARAEILLQWAILNYKYEHRLTALKDVWTAFGLLEDNLELFPDFISTYRSLGILHAFMGTLPMSDNMKWLLEKTSGMSGSIEQGLNELNKVIEYGNVNPSYIFNEECKGLYAYLLLHLANQPEAAWNAVQTITIQPEESVLAGFVNASLALRTGHLTDCLNVISRVKKNHQHRLPFNYFIKGKAELYLGKEECRNTFNQFLSTYKGESYRHAAYQKIAWSYLINEDVDGYRQQMDHCLSAENLIVGEDKDAHREAENEVLMNPFLLQARILFDGYQFESALQILNREDHLGINESTALEYYYRRGRIYQGLLLKKAAENDLKRAYTIGEHTDAYYACNAALQIGLLHENFGDNDEAEKWFDRCLEMNPDVYSKSLHHKAKAGLKRLAKN